MDTPQLVNELDGAAPPPSYECLCPAPASVLFSAYACNAAGALCCACSDSRLRGLTSNGVDGAVAPPCPDAEVVSSPASCATTPPSHHHHPSIHFTTYHSLLAACQPTCSARPNPAKQLPSITRSACSTTISSHRPGITRAVPNKIDGQRPGCSSAPLPLCASLSSHSPHTPTTTVSVPTQKTSHNLLLAVCCPITPPNFPPCDPPSPH